MGKFKFPTAYTILFILIALDALLRVKLLSGYC